MEEQQPSAPIPDIDDIAAPLAPAGNEWLLYAIIAASILSVALVIFVLTRRRKGTASQQDYDARRSAMDRLHTLKEEYTRIPSNACALGVSHAIREYLFAFHDPGAPYETSGELMRSLKQSGRPLPAENLDALRALLEECDFMQYGRAQDADSKRLGVIETAIAFIRDDSTRRATTPQEIPNPEDSHANSPAA